MVEVNEYADVISYEEYHPYGTTAYQAGPNAVEVKFKRYRYTGMERDEESGLGYHTARYYVPWLIRWTSFDPAVLTDGVNGYQGFRSNPVAFRDPTGRQSSTDVSGFPNPNPFKIEPLGPSPAGGFVGGPSGQDAYSDWLAENAKKEADEQAKNDELIRKQQAEWDIRFAELYEKERRVPRPVLGTTDDPTLRAVEQQIGPRPMTSGEWQVHRSIQFIILLITVRLALAGWPSRTGGTQTAGAPIVEGKPVVDPVSPAKPTSQPVAEPVPEPVGKSTVVATEPVPPPEAVQPTVVVPEGAPKPFEPPTRTTIPPRNPGETDLEYGNRLHYQEYQRIPGETNPGTTGQTAPRGAPGPDLPNSNLNATYGELKSFGTPMTRNMRQAHGWGLNPATGRYWLYDEARGICTEVIVQTEKLASGAFRSTPYRGTW